MEDKSKRSYFAGPYDSYDAAAHGHGIYVCTDRDVTFVRGVEMVSAKGLSERAEAAVGALERNIVAIEFDVATGRLWAVTDSEDTVLASAEQDRLTGKITLTFDY